MQRQLTAVLVLAILTGCLGWQKFRQDLHAYEGQKVDAMVQHLGAPDRTVDLPGEPARTAYTWKIRNRGGDHVCDVTAMVDRQSGLIAKVSDDCSNAR